MDDALYPLRFEPIYQYRLWGGRHFESWFTAPLPEDMPIGEAWVLSDREDYPSRVAEGRLKGQTIAQLMETSPLQLLGRSFAGARRFPLLLKFLDVQKMLSVQVHPTDDRLDLLPAGDTGKSEAWVVLEAGPSSRIYAGLKPGATVENLRTLSNATADLRLASFAPSCGLGVVIDAGVVHSLGDGVVVFEVQENSDVTFRLYDWEHIDPATGRSRPLQIEKALECVDYSQGVVRPVAAVIEATRPVLRIRLFDTAHFRLWRLQGAESFSVGAIDEPRVLVCIDGAGRIEYSGAGYALEKGAVYLLPASIGVGAFHPAQPVTMLEIALPERP